MDNLFTDWQLKEEETKKLEKIYLQCIDKTWFNSLDQRSIPCWKEKEKVDFARVEAKRALNLFKYKTK